MIIDSAINLKGAFCARRQESLEGDVEEEGGSEGSRKNKLANSEVHWDSSLKLVAKSEN